MQTITSTELRTKTSELVENLKKGERILLIHRSEVIGEIVPPKRVRREPNFDDFEDAIMAYSFRDKIGAPARRKEFEKHLQNKYGKRKNIS